MPTSLATSPDVKRRRCLRAFGGNSFVRWACSFADSSRASAAIVSWIACGAPGVIDAIACWSFRATAFSRSYEFRVHGMRKAWLLRPILVGLATVKG